MQKNILFFSFELFVLFLREKLAIEKQPAGVAFLSGS